MKAVRPNHLSSGDCLFVGQFALFLLAEMAGQLVGLVGGSAGKERFLTAVYRNHPHIKRSAGEFAGD